MVNHILYILLSVFLMTTAIDGVVWGQDEGEDAALAEATPAFVVVGYRSSLKLRDPETVQDEDEKKELEFEIEVLHATLDMVVKFKLEDWKEKYQLTLTYHNTSFDEGEGVTSLLHFHGEEAAHYLVEPLIFMGQKERVDQALTELNGSEHFEGQFKVEAIQENRYMLMAEFGYYDEEEEGNFSVRERFLTMQDINFSDFSKQISDSEILLDTLSELFGKKAPISDDRRSYIMKYSIRSFALLDESWIEDQFMVTESIHPDASAHTEGRLMIAVGTSERVREIKKD